jgi:4-amino-4-deoxy-L-arabinose transferase-like glycosyltransferase
MRRAAEELEEPGQAGVSHAAQALERPQLRARERAAALPPWWPLAGLLALAVAIRFSTLGLQSFWYDEAFTPVHVLRASLSATLHNVVHTENTPPLWYIVAWVWSRAFGTGAIALRSISAVAGVATVAVCWSIGSELAGRRAAIVLAGLVAVNPLFVWYSQEARAYALFVALSALSFLLFLRADREPSSRRLAGWALTSALALLTHYFAAFLIAPEAVWLLRRRGPASRTRALAAVGAVAVVGLSLIPLINAQGGHGTQWIGRWALSNRIETIPQYYLTGYTGSSLGHGIELLVLLTILAGLPLAPRLDPARRRVALLSLGIGAFAILAPLWLALVGADYLAPRNLVAAWIPITAAIATALAIRRSGIWLGALLAGGWLAIVLAVDLSPRLERGDWSDVAKALRGAPAQRAVVTPELGIAPLEYYLPPLHPLAPHAAVAVSEVDLVGYAPLTRSAGRTPSRGFRLAEHRVIRGLVSYRFVAPAPRMVSVAHLRSRTITAAKPAVLAP